MEILEKQEKEKIPQFYVAIGASAGGLEAIENFFSCMPSNSNLAFIVIQHLSPDYKSLMVELLSKKTDIKVLRAEDGMLVEANKIYLIPPKKNLTIFHGKLVLNDQEQNRGVNLPIDIFLKSLSEDQGEKAIAVILSGTGSDGTRGVRNIKEHGGMIMVQKEETAKFDGMPRAAISTGLADFILPPDEMPNQIILFSKHPNKKISDYTVNIVKQEDGLTKIFSILREKCRIDFTFYKPSTVTRRIERRMTVNHIDNLKEYVSFLSNTPSEPVSLYKELLIGVTSFFRDNEVFDSISDKWMNEIIKSSNESEIRFWVAGCSTGEEAYSLAIVARECMEKLGKNIDIKIFATDIDKDAIQYAATGIYPESIAADVSPKILTKYFFKKEDNFQIARTIREMVVFAQHNIIKDPPFTNISLLSCRNLLIYLQPILQRKVFEFFNFSLINNGFLILGTSETTGEMSDYFDVVEQKNKIFRSKGKAKFVSNQHINILSQKNNYKFNATKSNFRNSTEEKILETFLNSVANEFIPLAFIVNENFEIIHTIGDSQNYLKLPSGRMINDITKMIIKELQIPLSTGIQKVFRQNQELRFSNIRINLDAKIKFINLRIKPFAISKDVGNLVAVFISEIKKSENIENQNYLTLDLSKEAEEHLREIELDLQFTKENLQATIEELETSNEELQATNEELLASNEELQSTNEELQSTNEELFTVNAEYQSKIIELTELHNDIDNIINTSQIGILLLDENLEVRRFSPEVSKIFNLLNNDIGRSITHITHYLKKTDPFELIKKVQNTSVSLEKEVYNASGKCYLMRIVPYLIAPKAFSGIIVSFIDINQLKQAQIQNNKLSQAVENSPASIIITDINGKIEYVNKKFCLITQYSENELIGNYPNVLKSGKTPIELYKKLWNTILSGEEWRGELLNKKKNGEFFWEYASISSIKDNNNKITNFIAIKEDITEKKLIENKLFESEEKFRTLFETMELGVVYQNNKGEIISANPAAQNILGLTLEQLQGKKSIDPEWQSIFEDGTNFPGEKHPAMIALKTGKKVLNQIMGVVNQKNESLTWINICANPLFRKNEKQPFQVYATFEDITVKKEALDNLKKSKIQYQMLFNEIDSGIGVHEMIFDENNKAVDYRFLDINKAFENITGLKASEIVGKTFLEIFPETEKYWIEKYSKLFTNNENIYFEEFSKKLNKKFQVKAFKSDLNQFAVIFNQIK